MENPNTDLTVASLGEQQLLRRLFQFCSSDQVGDDAAVLTPQPNHHVVVTTDMLVDGVHFSDRTTSPTDIGWRSTTANLSDLAAMGAKPLGITVSLGLPHHLKVHWLEQLYEGIASCLRAYDTSIVGGDISRATSITVSITAFGEVLPDEQILRSTARPGDAIVVSGPHGAARAGLELLLHPELAEALKPEERVHLYTAHQRPRPRLDVIPLLQQLTPKPRVTGMDSSDGLADAILQICRASGVGAIIHQNCISLPQALQHSSVFSQQQVLQWSLYGGEDFELVLCLPPQSAHEWVAKLNSNAMIIGEIISEECIQLLDLEGKEQTLEMHKGFQHFG
ncbi:thiamine-phosphate kinase [Acaryochloris sp. IP29b_bin.137]|uniref:thiamine-phosphate kinase n=1 Tax=Acaryochloris sp. IP29b_bin.137 TaxID=2969217 RepID=UPI002614B168|nr:thiamine-phosphate kinase [Acaryochloris sp. IP29b_bin.137]